MIKFSQEKVLLLHKLIVEATGGSDGIRDFGLLDSALESAYATFDGKELFPTKEEKAARIGVGLVSNHAFVDGNKRIGIYVLLTFLEVNGIPLEATDEEVVDVGLRLAEGKMHYEELLQWIKDHQSENTSPFMVAFFFGMVARPSSLLIPLF